MFKRKRLDINALTIGIILLCSIIILIRAMYVPLRVYDKIVYLEVVDDNGDRYGLYECRVEHYLNGKVIIYHDCGEMQISDINNIKFYDIGEIKWKAKNKLS